MTKYLLLGLVVLFIDQTSGQTPVVGVSSCTHDDLEWYVEGGAPAGTTYLETSTSPDCVETITNGVNETFQSNFDTCGTLPKNRGGSLMEVIVSVLATSVYNTATDTRYLIECAFNSVGKVSFVEVTVMSNSPDADGNKATISITPEPLLKLNKYDPDTGDIIPTDAGEVIVIGQPMKLLVYLKVDLPGYDLSIGQCQVRASLPDSTNILSDLIVSDNEKKCSLYPTLFGNFVYDTNFSSAYRPPIAYSLFKMFMPVTPSADMRSGTLNLRYICQVQVCLTSSGECIHPTCPVPAARRKREAGDEEGEEGEVPSVHEYELDDAIRVQFGSNDDAVQPYTNEIEPHPADDTSICIDKGDFWAGLLSILALLLAAIAAACCLCFGLCKWCRCRRHRKYIDDRVSTYTTQAVSETTTGSAVDLVEEKTSTEKPMSRLFFLPRFVPMQNNSENTSRY